MSFNTSGALQGASAGMAFGPWGAVAGGVLGGLFGSDEPDPYTAEQFKLDTQPYQDMIDNNRSYGENMMNINSAFNMNLKNSLLNQGLDTLGVQNTIAQRNNAQQGITGVNAMTNAQLAANAQTTNENVFNAFNQGYQKNLGLGQRFLSDSMKHQGDLSMSLVDLGMQNADMMNQYNADKYQRDMGNFTSLMFGSGGKPGGIAQYGIDNDWWGGDS
jgi:hypothetical protein